MASVSTNNYGNGSRTRTGGMPTNPVSSRSTNTTSGTSDGRGIIGSLLKTSTTSSKPATSGTNLNKTGAEYLDIIGGKAGSSSKNKNLTTGSEYLGSVNPVVSGNSKITEGSKWSASTANSKNLTDSTRQALVDRVNGVTATDETPSGGYTPGGGGGGGGGNPSASAYGGYSSTNDDVVNYIKQLMDEQKVAADEAQKAWYEQALAKYQQQFRANQDQINLNRVRGRNYINQFYGDTISGPGISNRVRNDLNWASNTANNRLNYDNNRNTALATYNSGLANNASTLAQGWYNYVLPVYSNRQQNEDDYAYRKYLATL